MFAPCSFTPSDGFICVIYIIDVCTGTLESTFSGTFIWICSSWLAPGASEKNDCGSTLIQLTFEVASVPASLTTLFPYWSYCQSLNETESSRVLVLLGLLTRTVLVSVCPASNVK